MNILQKSLFGIRFYWRTRKSPAIKIVLFSVFLSVMIMNVLNQVYFALDKRFYQEASQILGGEIVLSSSYDIDTQYIDKAQQLKLHYAQTLETISMLVVGEDLQLVQLKAISENMPLIGTWELRWNKGAPLQKWVGAPKPSTIWVSPDLLETLSANLGQQAQIGDLPLKIGGILEKAPDSASDIFSFAPVVFMSLSDVGATGIVQPGSRVTYTLLLKGALDDIETYQAWVEEQNDLNIKIMTPKGSGSVLQRTLNMAGNYIGLLVVLTVVLSGAAIFMSTQHFSVEQTRTVALLKTLGVKQNEVLFLLSAGLLIWSLLMGGFGVVLGSGMLKGVTKFWPLAEGLGVGQFSVKACLLSLLCGLLSLIGFALGPLLRLKKITPVRILQTIGQTGPTTDLMALVLMVGVIALLLFYYLEAKTLILLVLSAIALIGIWSYILAIAALYCLALFRKKGSIGWRFGVNNLLRHKNQTVVQAIIFSLAVMSLLLLIIVKNDLLAQWVRALPENTPNYFAVNIRPENVKAFESFLTEKDIQDFVLYPVVRGKLIEVNGQQVKSEAFDADVDVELQEHESRPRGIYRPLNLTWMMDLPEDNQVISGENWKTIIKDDMGISVEAGFATRLGLKLGDVLTFQIGDRQLLGIISQFRTVEWESFKPNFFVIFSPKNMQDFPATFMTSFYVNPKQAQKAFSAQLVERFPEVSLINMVEIITQIRQILGYLTQTVQVLIFFMFVMGAVILYASLLASLPARFQEGALLRVLGAKKNLLRRAIFVEFSLLGVGIGVFASIGSVVLAKTLSQHVFSLNYHFNGSIVLFGVGISLCLLMMLGWYYTRHVIQISPLKILRA